MDIPLQKEEDLTPTYSLTVKRSEIVLKQEKKGIMSKSFANIYAFPYFGMHVVMMVCSDYGE
jgi:hypothetical protein